MDTGFKHNVKDFTQTLLHPDKLRTKQVSGETVTCESAINYVKVIRLTLHNLLLLDRGSEVDRMLPRLPHDVIDARFRRKFHG